MTDVIEQAVEEVTLNRYKLHITGADTIGINYIDNIVAMAALGAKVAEGTYPLLRYPHSVTMTLEAENPPVPSASIRVFNADTNKEIFAAFVEPVAATFSMEAEDVVDLSKNGDTPWTKEQLDSMDWETEFKTVCKSVGITGRSRDKMTKEYLAKFE